MSDKVRAASPSDAVELYACGLCNASACAPVDTPREVVEQRVNMMSPTGISSRWEISDENFAGGEPNPSPCPDADGRQHWLLEC